MTDLAPIAQRRFRFIYSYDIESHKRGGSDAFFWPEAPEKRKEAQLVRRGSPADFESVYQCRPGRRDSAVFSAEDFAYYAPPVGLQIGLLSPAVAAFCAKGSGIWQAWDTAFSKTVGAAYTVGITGLFIACNSYHRGESPEILGPCEPHFDIAVLNVFRDKVEAGDLGGKGLLPAVRSEHRKWRPEAVIIENRASGIELIHALPSFDIPVIGVTAKEGKRARALSSVDGAGSAQGWFKLHRVLFPLKAPWKEALETELKDFVGDESGLTDQVDALVHLVVYAIRLGSQTMLLPSDWSPERIGEAGALQTMNDLASDLAQTDPRARILEGIGFLPSLGEDPFSMSCGGCKAYLNGNCATHHRRVTPFDICPSFEAKSLGGPMAGMALGPEPQGKNGNLDDEALILPADWRQ
jgi:phage terminase large subunit-like protein